MSHTGLQIQHDWCLYKNRRIWAQTQYLIYYKEKRVIWGWKQRLEWCFHKPRNAKECQGEPAEPRSGASDRVFLSRNWHCWHSGLRLRALTAVRQYISIFKPLRLWTLLRQPLHTNVGPTEPWRLWFGLEVAHRGGEDGALHKYVLNEQRESDSVGLLQVGQGGRGLNHHEL